jgi:hypothetical protein
MPPKVRDRQPANASPGRRVTDQPAPGTVVRPAPDRRSAGTGDAGAVRRNPDRAPERTPGRRTENRLVQPNIEARRAREPEERRSIIPDARDIRGRRTADEGG